MTDPETQSESDEQPSEGGDSSELPTLRKIVHDINGEIFLIRGYADITSRLIKNNEQAFANMGKIMERTDQIEAIVKNLKKKQQVLEPS